jgi:tellurite resistance protein
VSRQKWGRGHGALGERERTVQFLVERNRLESFEADDLAALTEALIGRAVLRVETTATAALAGGDVDGAFVAAYDAYRMTAEALLARQALRATGGDGSHIAVEDAVSAQFGAEIPAFTKPTVERLRRARHAAQYFDPSAAPLTASDATWAIGKAKEARLGAKALLATTPSGRFS